MSVASAVSLAAALAGAAVLLIAVLTGRMGPLVLLAAAVAGAAALASVAGAGLSFVLEGRRLV